MLSSTTTVNGWLMIIYRVPSTPSTSRVTIWKRIKELGAHLLQQSVYILPNLPQVKEAVNTLKEYVQHLGGECKVIEISSLGEEQEREVINGFNSSREEEYTEVVKACNELLAEIIEESNTQDFHFADLEENEKHLQRVKDLFDSVKARDYFVSPLQLKATELITQCQQQFDEFSHHVYAREGIETDDKKIVPDTRIYRKEIQYVTKQSLKSKVVEIISSLNRGDLVIEGKPIGKIAGSALMECEFKELKNEKILEIKISWTPPVAKKS
jgi:hypothetical protein